MNVRARMRETNRAITEHLLNECGFLEVWLKPHTKFHDLVYKSDGTRYRALDLFNLWDGIGLKAEGVYFLQLKTNAFAKNEPLNEFCSTYNVRGLNINRKLNKKTNEWEIIIREHPQ